MDLGPLNHRNPPVDKVWIDGAFLRWEIRRGGKKSQLKSTFPQKLAELEPTEDALVAFIREYGPLWRGDRIRLQYALALIRSFRFLCDLLKDMPSVGQFSNAISQSLDERFFAKIEGFEDQWRHLWEGAFPVYPPGYTTDPQGASDAVGDYLVQEYKMSPLEKLFRTIESPKRPKYKLWYLVQKDGSPFFMAVEDTNEYWPRFSPVEKSFSDWKERKEWFSREMVQNVIKLLRSSLVLRPVQRGQLIRLSLECADAYAWAVARVALNPMRRCPVCKKLTSGTTYCTRACEKAAWSTSAKQHVLDYLCHQKRRGKLTTEQYKHCKVVVEANKYLEDRLELAQRVKVSVAKKWPSIDFGFLDGYGSRSGEGTSGNAPNNGSTAQ